MKLRSLVVAGTAAVAVCAAAPAANAATGSDTTSITLSAGSLTFDTNFTADNFPNTTLNGLAQVVNAKTNAWAVNDATGSLLGWNVKVRASQFSTGGGTPKTLPEASMTYLGVDTGDISTTVTGLTNLNPVPVAVAAAIDSASGTNDQTIVQALVGKGSGKWDFAANNTGLSLAILPTAEPGTYTSTITTTLSSGVA